LVGNDRIVLGQDLSWNRIGEFFKPEPQHTQVDFSGRLSIYQHGLSNFPDVPITNVEKLPFFHLPYQKASQSEGTGGFGSCFDQWVDPLYKLPIYEAVKNKTNYNSSGHNEKCMHDILLSE
jgi:hypothetical protein